MQRLRRLGELSTAVTEQFFSYAFLAAAAALQGNDAEAKTALAEARRLNPQITTKWLTAHTLTAPLIIDGLRKAGLPEE
jgi:predicted Zn-dependent protease